MRVSTSPNGEVPGEVSQPNTYGSPCSVVSRYRFDASSANSLEWIDT